MTQPDSQPDIDSDIHSDIRGSLIDLIERLEQADLDWDAENIVDGLWLARYMADEAASAIETTEVTEAVEVVEDAGEFQFDSEPSPPHLADTQPPELPERDDSPPDLGLYSPPPPEPEPSPPQPSPQGIPFQTPTAPALRKTLGLGRALRPLMRKVDSYTQTVLDEEATAEQTAEQQFCMTVVKPDQERWLEVALVIEESASSFLWQETIRDFKQVLERQGAFRAVTVWHLQTSATGEVALFTKRPRPGELLQPRSPKELIDASGRRLILLASDCISAVWRSERLHSDYLQLWGDRGLLAVVQMLPSHLWKRTALSSSLSVQLGAWSPGVANHQLLFREVPIGVDSDPSQGLKIPVITLEPSYLEPWGRMVAGFGESWATGVWFDPGWQAVDLPTPARPAPALTPEQLVQRFDATASGLAKRLAGLMALVPVSLPIIYLLQETMLPSSTPLHMAEVFMSALIQRGDPDSLSETEPNQHSSKVYEFAPGVRELLSAGVPTPMAEAALNRVSQYIGSRLGKSIYSFTALLMLEQELGVAGGTELLKFAQITKQTLKRMGGGYAALVDALEQPGVATASTIDLSELEQEESIFPELEPFEFIDARLDDGSTPAFPPPLQTEEFTVITVEAEPESQPDVDGVLSSFEFTVATLRPRVSRQRLEGPPQATNWVTERTENHAYHFMESMPQALSLDMVVIPSGKFLMGSLSNEPAHDGNESPQHEVTIRSFCMGRYPITQAQWQAVAHLPQAERFLDPNPSHFKGSEHPVERVSWYDALEFCARLSIFTGRNYRLPTEAEWEYACRAQTTTPFHFGETITTDLANYQGTSAYGRGYPGDNRQQTTPVSFFRIANQFGLCDMHGNVREWCQDQWHNNYEGAPSDGRAWISNNKNVRRVLRGGSWSFRPALCRSASRGGHSGVLRSNIGFRVCCPDPQ